MSTMFGSVLLVNVSIEFFKSPKSQSKKKLFFVVYFVRDGSILRAK